MTAVLALMRRFWWVPLLALAVFAIAATTCSRKDAAQERQNTASADAYAGSAKNAVETVTARASEEASVDTVVAQATQEIDDAKDPDAARAAVVSAVCKLRAYRDRPECAVQ